LWYLKSDRLAVRRATKPGKNATAVFAGCQAGGYEMVGGGTEVRGAHQNRTMRIDLGPKIVGTLATPQLGMASDKRLLPTANVP